MNTWGKVLTGAVVGVIGTIYATNEEARKNLPKGARDLPENVRRRYKNAVSAAREASSRRRQEILAELERHDRAHAGVAVRPPSEQQTSPEAPAETAPDAGTGTGERPAPATLPPARPSAGSNVESKN